MILVMNNFMIVNISLKQKYNGYHWLGTFILLGTTLDVVSMFMTSLAAVVTTSCYVLHQTHVITCTALPANYVVHKCNNNNYNYKEKVS